MRPFCHYSPYASTSSALTEFYRWSELSVTWGALNWRSEELHTNLKGLLAHWSNTLNSEMEHLKTFLKVLIVPIQKNVIHKEVKLKSCSLFKNKRKLSLA